MVFVGVATYDAIAAVSGYPGPDSRVVADRLVYAGGGPAATAAVACARLGVPARFVGAVARDDIGEAILRGLGDEGVDVSGVLRVPGESGSSVVVVDTTCGTRAICNRPGPMLQVAPGSGMADALAAARWVHVDQAGWQSVHGLGLRRLSVDGGNPIPGFDPAGVALYAPTMQRLRATFGEHAPSALLRRARDAGAGCVVATDGSHGSYCSRDGEAWHVPAMTGGSVVSTLGAGDVFHGALLAAVVRGFDLPTCTAYANVAAALSCRGLDGRSAIPGHDEVMASLPSLRPVPMELA